VAAGLQDPGNLGTILRSAEAFGAAGVFLTEGTVSPYNSKVLRGSAGSIFRLPFLQISSAELIPLCARMAFACSQPRRTRERRCPKISWTLPLAIFIGNEGAGLSRELMREMDETLVIPQAAQVESLNAGVAASIVLYEAASKSSKVRLVRVCRVPKFGPRIVHTQTQEPSPLQSDNYCLCGEMI
jgi:RNA methyltransferase, TrmH family